MEVNPLLFRDLTYIFLAAVGGGLLAWRLKLAIDLRIRRGRDRN